MLWQMKGMLKGPKYEWVWNRHKTWFGRWEEEGYIRVKIWTEGDTFDWPNRTSFPQMWVHDSGECSVCIDLLSLWEWSFLFDVLTLSNPLCGSRELHAFFRSYGNKSEDSSIAPRHFQALFSSIFFLILNTHVTLLLVKFSHFFLSGVKKHGKSEKCKHFQNNVKNMSKK